MLEFRQQLSFDALMVADSALYSADNLKLLQGLRWISRVPLTVAETKRLVNQLKPEEFIATQLPGYRIAERESLYGGVAQTKHSQHVKPGRPRKDAQPSITYRIQATLERNQEAISRALTSSGRFVLATNITDSAQLSAEQVLQEYKAQQSPERGFRFLKDPLFFTNSVFLKSPERIAALAFVMGLCLLVYNLGQRQLRHDESRGGDEPSQPTWSSDSASYLTLGVSVFSGCASVAGCWYQANC
jgi:transposase